jgi:uncharacterized membrane protein
MLLKHRLASLGGAALFAVGTYVFAPSGLSGTTRFVASYDAGALVLLAVMWLTTLKPDSARTQRRSALEDPGRNIVLGIVLLSVLAGFASAIVILGRGASVPTPEKNMALGFGIAAVLLGWLLIHSIFIFRYAHLFYYDDDDDGSAQRGLIFPGTAQPDDYDFAYFSFVIGMTFQVSDVQIIDRGVRRVVLFHALIAFAYNTAILALVVNLGSGLLAAK